MDASSAPVARKVPVVMVSADATQGKIKRLLAAGADYYFKDAGSRELVPRRLLQRTADRGRRRVELPPGEVQERESRLRVRAEPLGLAERVVRLKSESVNASRSEVQTV